MPSLRFTVAVAALVLAATAGAKIIPTGDVCIKAKFEPAQGLPSHTISGNPCPTGPGGG